MAGSRRPGSRRLALIVGASISIVALVGGPVAAEEGGEGRDLPVEFVHNNLEDAPVAGAVWAAGPALKNGDAICSTAPTNDANVNVSCEGVGPHNETSIAVNPTDPDNLISGANDYQLAINPGGHVTASTRSRATVSFDGGHSWTTYPIRTTSTYQATGDPAVAFDAAGNAYYATLGFRFVGPANAQNPDILVSVSKDGGVHWDAHRVAQGSGNGHVRRRPARQGVRDGVGRRQRAGHVWRLPARPQGRAGVRPDLLDRDPRRGRHVDDTGAGLRRRAVRVRLDAHRDR